MTCICGVSSWSDGGLLVLLQQAAAVELNLLSSQWKENKSKELGHRRRLLEIGG
jgi:hypothetical protein